MDQAEKISKKKGLAAPGAYNDGLVISKNRNPSNDQQFCASGYKNVLTTNFGKYAERFDDFDYNSPQSSANK